MVAPAMVAVRRSSSGSTRSRMSALVWLAVSGQCPRLIAGHSVGRPARMAWSDAPTYGVARQAQVSHGTAPL